MHTVQARQPSAGRDREPGLVGAPAIAPELADELSAETLAEIEHTLTTSPVCTVCDLPIRPEFEQHPSVIALQRPDSTALIRFAHEECAPPRLIPVAHPPTAAQPARRSEPAAAHVEGNLAWALLTRDRRVPTIALVLDVAEFAALEVRGEALLAALRLEGLRGGRPIDQLDPVHADTLSVSREGARLVLDTPWGGEPLALDDTPATFAVLHLAARQHAIVVILGRNLELAAGELDEVERQLCFADAIATIATYIDPALATVPLNGSPLRRVARGLSTIAPSTRARRREARRAAF